MSSIPARYLICIALCACTVACLVTAGCSNPSGQQPEIGSDLSGDLVVHFIDVGQGDSILIEFRDKTMLIDAGERGMGERVIAYLDERNVETLDVVVATHAHSDHIGGLSDVISAYPVGRFVDAAQPHPTATYENLLVLVEDLGIPYTAAERGQSVALDPDLEILILNPGAEPLGDINEDSVVLMVTYGEISYLFTGDAGTPAEESMAEAGLDLDADVLKVGHHASRYASSAEFLSSVSPAISVIEVGEGNDYGHPHEEAVERLEATGSRIYRTDLDGTVIVATDGTALTVAAGGAPAATVTAGATTAAATATPTATATPAPSSGVYISDLGLQEEWIAVANADETAVNLTGWTITDEGTRNTYTFPVYTLDPGADVTVHSGAGNDTATDLYWGRGSAVWNNDGDLATLADANGTVVSTMER
ncbi:MULTISPECIES: MBL fold metallo-hydrolase [Methanoculleus]|uniref:Beta-lactamase domain protein n=2 Tax=Methanoculleus TaxID=45989 RepID=A3CW90_METMJ|nr:MULTISPECIES: lamin tail domain-containing protein [Methanoculleus]ABN57640.1 beta-lactamase domain protein [Methanoculleus marisnigri JR1]UYU19037.1 lamin tail domain-containing protein [Methanoculleus submarinus]